MVGSNGEWKAHFVLVHSAGYGVWCWYKIKLKLKSGGHRVTVLNLTASGINIKVIEKNVEESSEFFSMFMVFQSLVDFLDAGDQK
ncbi:hypothetical protein ACFX2B_012918 [Malus domestica]